MDEPRAFDLRGYLERIGLDIASGPTLATLDALHVAHLARIPFENIDVFLRRPGCIDLESLENKIVRGGRGGYCFEQNSLFAAALRALGYEVYTLEARVRPPGATALLPRTHMVLRVYADGQSFAADVGFGADGPLLPVPLDGTPREQPDGVYRVEREGPEVHVVRHGRGGSWRDLYAFTLAPAEPVDFEVAHHYTSTHPGSRFVQTLTVQRSEARVRHVLRGRTYTVRRNDAESAREMDADELGALLGDVFALRLPVDLLRELTDAFGRLPLG